jgi:chromosome segregation protein
MSEISKLRDLISKNESRITDLRKSIQSALDTFSSETNKVLEAAGSVTAELDEWDKKMADYDSTISSLEERRKDLRSEVSELEQKHKEIGKKTSSATSESTSAQKDIIKAQDNLRQYKDKIEKLKAELEELNKETSDLNSNVDSLKESNENEFKNLGKGHEGAKQKLAELIERSPIKEFLLTHGESEPPEVTIVSELIRNEGEISVDDLRKKTKINSNTSAKAIESLEKKGILVRADKEHIRLLKKPET